MTTELEKQFYKTFGIEPTIYSLWDSKETQIKNFKSYEVYPEITDRILLKLICKAYCLMFSIQGTTVEILKENILKEFIYWKDDVVKSEIQQLFKGGE